MIVKKNCKNPRTEYLKRKAAATNPEIKESEKKQPETKDEDDEPVKIYGGTAIDYILVDGRKITRLKGDDDKSLINVMDAQQALPGISFENIHLGDDGIIHTFYVGDDGMVEIIDCMEEQVFYDYVSNKFSTGLADMLRENFESAVPVMDPSDYVKELEFYKYKVQCLITENTKLKDDVTKCTNAVSSCMENIEKFNSTLSEFKFKADYYDNVMSAKDSFTISVIASEYGRTAVWLNKKLKELNVQYRQGGA